MRSLDFTVELRAARFDVGVRDALIFNMPVELSLKFMTIVSSGLLYTEWKFLDDVINEVDRSVLTALDLLPGFSFEYQKLYIHLDVVAGNLLIITFGVDLIHWSQLSSSRRTLNKVSR